MINAAQARAISQQNNYNYLVELECKKFYYGRDVEVTYSSHKLKPNGKPDYYDEISNKEKHG